MRCGYFWYQRRVFKLGAMYVYTVLYVFLTSLIGLCCKIDYSLETELKIMTFELCFMRWGIFLGGSGNVIWKWEGNGNEI